MSFAGSGVVSLTTDFGLRDAYVGVMKAVILGVNPAARVVDLGHEVAPQAVPEAAFLLETAWHYFPDGSVHVVVVDPGVGTARRRLAIVRDGHAFVGPDNGVLSAALAQRQERRPAAAYAAASMPVPAGVEVVAIENEALFLTGVSATFEGRDVFAPVAAHLSRGGSLAELGPAVGEIEAFPAFRAVAHGDGIEGRVMRVDRYGNLITDIGGDQVGPTTVFEIAGRTLGGLAPTYAESPGLKALVGSSGRVEVALTGGSAAGALAIGAGAVVRAR